MAATYQRSNMGNCFQYEITNFPYNIQERANTTLHYYPQQKFRILTKGHTKIVTKSSEFSTQNVAISKCVSNLKESEKMNNLVESVDDDVLNRLCYAMGLDKLYYLPELSRMSDLLEGM